MRNNAIQTFTRSPRCCTGGQGGAEEAFEPGEHAFRLPALSVDPTGKPILHLTTITSVGTTGTSAGVHGNDGGPDTEFFATEPMVRLGIVGPVGEQPIDRKVAHGLGDRGHEVGCVITGACPHPSGSDEVRVVVTDDGELGPWPVPFHAALAVQEVSADVMALQSGGIDAGFALLFQQAIGPGDTENGVEQLVKSPFFRSRCSA